MTLIDLIALFQFAVLWIAFGWTTGGARLFKRRSLTRMMNGYRSDWIRNSIRRDLKIIDTQIISGLQNGTAFFASASIFALGGCFALLGATDQVQAIFNDLPYVFKGGKAGFELKVGGLACIFGYAFFKFGWSYRLFNYCSILFGAIPMVDEAKRDPIAATDAAERAARMNMLAGKHFNAGLRAIFLSIGYLGWFINAYVFMASSALVIFVLVRRQFFSEARMAIAGPEDIA